MLNNEYYRIYNESLEIIFDSLSELLKEKKPFIEHYTLYNNKKITDYMLFVRDFYKNRTKEQKINNNIKNKSKYIALLWKNLDKEEKKKYKNDAKSMLDYFKENYKKKKPKEIMRQAKAMEQKEITKEKLFKKDNLRNNILKKIKIKDIEYYIDWNNNLIDINKHEYIGYLKGDIIDFFH